MHIGDSITRLRSVTPRIVKGVKRPGIGLPAAVELGLQLRAALQQALALGTELALELDHEGDSLRRQYLLVAGLQPAGDVHAGRR